MLGSVKNLFEESTQKVTRAFGLHIRVRIAYAPIPKITQGKSKIQETNIADLRAAFFYESITHLQKHNSKRSPTGWLYFRGGAPRATPGAHFVIQAYFYSKK